MPSSQPLFQFSIRSLLAWMAMIAVFCAATFSAADYWRLVTSFVITVWLCWHIVMTITGRGSDRAFSCACAVFTAIFLLTFSGGLKNIGIDYQTIPGEIALVLHADSWGTDPRTGGRTIVNFEKQVTSAAILSHAIPLLIGALAAYICRAAYIARERERRNESELQ